jgi:hypothetical protein
MAKIAKQDLLKTVTTFYLESRDFNGIPTWTLLEKSTQDWTSLKMVVKGLIEEELVGLIDRDSDANPHIIRRGFEPKATQISKLEGASPLHGCIYPTPRHLRSVVDPQDYEGEPYRLCLALGEAQLAYRSFDLSVLEFYRNDPRYSYENDDIHGHIYYYYNADDLSESDRAFIETFGFSYDDEYNRAVAVYLRYLARLTQHHQQIWKAKELEGNYKLHPDYYRSTILGNRPERAPICSALLKELYVINQMAKAMGRPPFFKDDYGRYGDNRPKRFGFLIRPTLDEFNSFMLLFDKMLSENINQDFFQRDVAYENEIERKDGKIQIEQKGTLQILDDWMHKSFRTPDWGPWEESIATLRRIRKMRQKPAHSVNEDQFDQKYFKQQREIIMQAYSAVRTIRLMFSNHRRVKVAKIEIPDWLQEGKIWTM